MKKTLVFAPIFLIACHILSAQNPEYGAKTKAQFGIFDATQFDKYLRVIEGVGSSARDPLIEQSLKSYMMPPRRTVNSTSSATYAVANALEFYVNLNNNYKDNLSPDFIKLNLPQGSIEDDLTFLATTGTVSAAILPFESAQLNPSVYSAIKYKIRNFLKLFQPTTRPQQRIYDVKKALMRGNPVIVELQITNEFRQLRQVRFWQATAGDRTPSGSQFVVVVGYDEERKAVEILNSAGREWGNGGYIWLSFEDFGNLATSGYVLVF